MLCGVFTNQRSALFAAEAYPPFPYVSRRYFHVPKVAPVEAIGKACADLVRRAPVSSLPEDSPAWPLIAGAVRPSSERPKTRPRVEA